MTDRIRFTDRLRDRGFIDQWGFMAFAVVGFAAIVSAKWFEIPTLWVALGAVGAMLAYALVIGRAGTGRVRADQAGDNCYYLGLIYTLASLSYAIATFDPNDTASTIVQGFGIALATTIFGLILRVFFNQGRPDLENVEEQARLELTDASSRLKAELNQAVGHLNDVVVRARQAIAEMNDASTASIAQFTEEAVTGLKAVTQAASETIRGEANDFAARSKRYGTSFDKLLAKLEAHGEHVEALAQSHETLAATAASVRDTAESAGKTVEHLSGAATRAAASAAAAETAGAHAGALLETMLSTVGDLRTSLDAIHQATASQLEQLASGPGKAATNTAAALEAAAAGLKQHAEQLAELHRSITQRLGQQSEEGLRAARQHNEALESELGTSRELALRLHGEFVDMTGKLADTLEGRP